MERTGLSRRTVALGTMAGAAACATPQAVAPTLTEALRALFPLLGRWSGRGEGEPGVSAVERSYRVALDGRFIEVRNRSVYAAQPANPSGETHEDIGYYSFDRTRRRVIFRQFHTEGFVNQYVATSEASLVGAFVMETEAIENIPPGFRARETLTVDSDTLTEVFEIAEPGKAFAVYSRNVLRRN